MVEKQVMLKREKYKNQNNKDLKAQTEKELNLKKERINNELSNFAIIFCNTISIVPIFGEVSTSPNSNFIILSFDLIQCNPSVTTEIKINE